MTKHNYNVFSPGRSALQEDQRELPLSEEDEEAELGDDDVDEEETEDDDVGEEEDADEVLEEEAEIEETLEGPEDWTLEEDGDAIGEEEEDDDDDCDAEGDEVEAEEEDEDDEEAADTETTAAWFPDEIESTAEGEEVVSFEETAVPEIKLLLLLLPLIWLLLLPEFVIVKSWSTPGWEETGIGGGGDPTETVLGEKSASERTRHALMISLISRKDTDWIGMPVFFASV